MIEKKIVQPSGKLYATAWLDNQSGNIKIKLAKSGYTVSMDKRVAADLAQFFTEVNFYNFCENKK